jgi:hypothetical protein
MHVLGVLNLVLTVNNNKYTSIKKPRNPYIEYMYIGESLVTMPSALVREIWDEKWQLSRPGPLYLNLFLEIYF